MSTPSTSTPQRRRRLIIGAGLAVLLVIGIVLGIWAATRPTTGPTGIEPDPLATPTSRLTVALPTTYPTEPPPSVPITEPSGPVSTAAPRITSADSVTTAEVPGFTSTEPTDDEEALAEGALAAETNTFSSQGQDIKVAASEWSSAEDAAARAQALRDAAPGRLIQQRTFGPNGEGTYWYYQEGNVATQVWLIGDVAGSFTGDPTEVQNLALRMLHTSR